jgi:hypothetical protein
LNQHGIFAYSTLFRCDPQERRALVGSHPWAYIAALKDGGLRSSKAKPNPLLYHSRLERLADSIVEGGADFANLLALAIGPGAVGEQGDGDARFKIDP